MAGRLKAGGGRECRRAGPGRRVAGAAARGGAAGRGRESALPGPGGDAACGCRDSARSAKPWSPRAKRLASRGLRRPGGAVATGGGVAAAGRGRAAPLVPGPYGSPPAAEARDGRGGARAERALEDEMSSVGELISSSSRRAAVWASAAGLLCSRQLGFLRRTGCRLKSAPPRRRPPRRGSADLLLRVGSSVEGARRGLFGPDDVGRDAQRLDRAGPRACVAVAVVSRMAASRAGDDRLH